MFVHELYRWEMDVSLGMSACQDVLSICAVPFMLHTYCCSFNEYQSSCTVVVVVVRVIVFFFIEHLCPHMCVCINNCDSFSLWIIS